MIYLSLYLNVTINYLKQDGSKMLPIYPYTISQAIAREEGFYATTTTPNRPQRNNNPGDLEYHPWQSEFGAVKGLDPRFAYFPTVEQGWDCLKRLLSFPAYKGKTIEQFVEEFAPSNENNTKQYALNIAYWCRLTLTTIIDNHI